MSNTIFPAAPGTYLIERERGETDARLIPVVGFHHIQGGIVFPLCAINTPGLTLGRALVTPDGFVTDPAAGVVCGSREEWMRLTNSDGYWKKEEPRRPQNADAPEKRRTTNPPPGEEPEEEPDNVEVERPQTPTQPPARQPRIPDKPKGKPQVFQTTSFWRGRLNNAEFLFTVAPSEFAPAKNDPSFEKIKRDDWQALKKGGLPVRDWPLRDLDATADDDDAAASALI